MPITNTDFFDLNSAKKEQELKKLMDSISKSEGSLNHKLAVVILAAGLGKRMKSPDKPKVMFEINGKPMIQYATELALKCNAERVIPIVGHHREQVIELLDKLFPNRGISYAIQEEQKGTGHAVMQTEPLLKDFTGDVLILSGDVPLLKYDTVQKLLDEHFSNDNDATLLTTEFKNAEGYGRIVRDANRKFSKIVEHKDATPEQLKLNEINPAIYIVKSKLLFDALKKISPENNQNEYYLTDIFNFISPEKMGTVVTNDELEVTGVNSIEQLKEMETELNSR